MQRIAYLYSFMFETLAVFFFIEKKEKDTHRKSGLRSEAHLTNQNAKKSLSTEINDLRRIPKKI